MGNDKKLKKIIMEPRSGENISECIQIAIANCALEGVDIEFVHNDRLFRVKYDDVEKTCKEIKK